MMKKEKKSNQGNIGKINSKEKGLNLTTSAFTLHINRPVIPVKAGTVVYTHNLSNLGSRDRRIMVQGQLMQKR
jgi:hypothetical protein